MGIAERKRSVDNPAFTNMSAVIVLRDAIAAARQLKRAEDPCGLKSLITWLFRCAEKSLFPMTAIAQAKKRERVFPLRFPLGDDVQAATLDFYLDRADDYIGSPMLSALYGVWAAAAGNRRLSAKLIEDGYGRFCVGRFMQTLEYREDVFPEQPRAGPFFANLGFLSGLFMGFTGLRPSPVYPAAWVEQPVFLPAGWRSIEVDRVWIHGSEARLSASHGAKRATFVYK